MTDASSLDDVAHSFSEIDIAGDSGVATDDENEAQEVLYTEAEIPQIITQLHSKVVEESEKVSA